MKEMLLINDESWTSKTLVEFARYLATFQREGLVLNYPRKISQLLYFLKCKNNLNFEDFCLDKLFDIDNIELYYKTIIEERSSYHDLTISKITFLQELHALKHFIDFLELYLPEGKKISSNIEVISSYIFDVLPRSKIKDNRKVIEKENSSSLKWIFECYETKRYLSMVVAKYKHLSHCINEKHYNFLLRHLLSIICFKSGLHPYIASNLTMSEWLKASLTKLKSLIIITNDIRKKPCFIILDKPDVELFRLYVEKFRDRSEIQSDYFFLGFNSKDKLENVHEHLYFHQVKDLNFADYAISSFMLSERQKNLENVMYLCTSQNHYAINEVNKDKVLSFLPSKSNIASISEADFDAMEHEPVDIYLNILNLSELDAHSHSSDRFLHSSDKILKRLSNAVLDKYPISFGSSTPSEKEILECILEKNFSAKDSALLHKQINAVRRRYKELKIEFYGEFILDTRFIPQMPRDVRQVISAIRESSIAKYCQSFEKIAAYVIENYRHPAKRPKLRDILMIDKTSRILSHVDTQDWAEYGLVIKYNLPHRGRGIFAKRSFIKDEVVTDLDGFYTCIKEISDEDDDDSDFKCYFRYDGKLYCCDASVENNTMGRLINHSFCCNNVVGRPVVLPSITKPRLIFVAIIDINSGDEILFDYCDKGNSELNSFQCPKCGITPNSSSIKFDLPAIKNEPCEGKSNVFMHISSPIKAPP